MFEWLKPQNKSILGIDISSVAVKIIELAHDGEDLKVEAFAMATLPEKAVENNSIKDINAVATAIKRALAKTKFTTKAAALAVPDAAVITKVIQLNDGLNDEEMEELVVLEADKFIPYAIDEINIDFEVLGPSQKNPALLDVLIVASRAENVSNRAESARLAGLEPKVIEVESYAAERALQYVADALPAQGKDKVIAVIDMGYNFTHLFVLYGMKLIFSREETFGGHLFFESIAEQMEMSVEEAEQAYFEDKLSEEHKKNCLKQFDEMMLVQLRRALQFFYSSSDYSYVDHILLAGGMAKLEGLAEIIHASFEVPVSIANPFEHFKMGKHLHPDSLERHGAALLVALGLALREY